MNSVCAKSVNPIVFQLKSCIYRSKLFSFQLLLQKDIINDVTSSFNASLRKYYTISINKLRHPKIYRNILYLLQTVVSLRVCQPLMLHEPCNSLLNIQLQLSASEELFHQENHI